MIKAIGICAALTCLLPPPVSAAPPSRDGTRLTPVKQEARAVRVLLAVPADGGDVFALGRIGRGGPPPAKFFAYKAILRRGDASAVFQRLLNAPSPVTQMYALTGLSKCDPAALRALVPRFSKRRDEVRMMSGCIVFSRSIGDAVGYLAAGKSPMTIPLFGGTGRK